jgi:hypothetical protein
MDLEYSGLMLNVLSASLFRVFGLLCCWKYPHGPPRPDITAYDETFSKSMKVKVV